MKNILRPALVLFVLLSALTGIVYPLAVTEMLADYPEREERENAWFSPEDAAKRVHESSLKSLILAFAEKA